VKRLAFVLVLELLLLAFVLVATRNDCVPGRPSCAAKAD
jgi:hypothetical protein